MAKYDEVAWHHGGDFPAGLPRAAAATHIGMFLAWCVFAGLASDELLTGFADEIAELRERRLTPGQLLMAVDEQLVDTQLTDTGNAFAAAYYSADEDDGEPAYFDDYVDVFDDDADEIYAVPDTWATFDRMAAQLTRRFDAWRAGGEAAATGT